MKAYSGYKDSGVEWLGEIPEHWECIRMKHLFKDHSEKNKPNEELLSVTQNQGVVPRSWVENRMVMPSGALESFKFIKKGDFAISLRSFEGGLEYCYHDGIISPAYTVLKTKRKIADNYYKYLFKSFSFISELQTSIVGIREGKNISYPELSYSFLPVPVLEEQTAIANFLDEKTAKINQAIAIKEQQIALLKERKQIIIRDAVTKGLDKKVKYKDSRVEWIGEIPEHWEVKRLKYILKIRNTKILSKNSDFKYVGMENIQSQSGKYIETLSDVEGLSNYFEKGDILFGKLRPYLAKVYLAKFEGICSTEFIVYYSPFNNFYQKVLLSNDFINFVDSSTYGAKMPRANAEWIGNIFLPYPTIVEQQAIVSHIETQSSKIDEVVSIKEQEIEKLKEYKMSLIDSVVTGKVKVC
ncbi:restriction endonuclease subunit S [Flavobacterium sp. NRK1]|uniref:restriction endonuclease subunit S n=1 Tax=Flavobacterium sp. NRK1 TaxID=2954929 RepID=UPI0020939DE8|nr:restriction endonuclease subunit S [Flavobacterium sp. NRK1]MCO6148948.1 restriction endonuclease subunit S [Flavobacterium sp. NRK1]